MPLTFAGDMRDSLSPATKSVSDPTYDPVLEPDVKVKVPIETPFFCTSKSVSADGAVFA